MAYTPAFQVDQAVKYNGKPAKISQIIIIPTEHGLKSEELTEAKVKSVEALISQDGAEFRVPISMLSA